MTVNDRNNMTVNYRNKFGIVCLPIIRYCRIN